MEPRRYWIDGRPTDRETIERTLEGMRRDHAESSGTCRADLEAAIGHLEAALSGRISVNPRLYRS